MDIATIIIYVSFAYIFYMLSMAVLMTISKPFYRGYIESQGKTWGISEDCDYDIRFCNLALLPAIAIYKIITYLPCKIAYWIGNRVGKRFKKST